MQALDTLVAAAKGLGQHPQDHGWRDLYRLFAYGLEHPAPRLQEVLKDSYDARPTSATHLLTLLGIALKFQTPETFARLITKGSYDARVSILEATLTKHCQVINRILLTRYNSFTCARRYLVTQVLLSAYFAQAPSYPLNFADLGTGIGVLPRQLNSKQVYQNLCNDLIWPGGIPEFRPIPLTSTFGVDRGPMPDRAWVHACYGPSAYYAKMYQELIDTLDNPDVQNSRISFHELDLLDAEALTDFLHDNHINVANMTYVLYEFDSATRTKVIETIVRNLQPPGILLVTEPCDELQRQGCIIELFRAGDMHPLSLCYVSDGHFKGYVLPLDDYDDFTSGYPILYSL